MVDFCGFRFFFRYMSKFSLFFLHSQLQEFVGTLRCFGFVVNVDWAVIPWAGERKGIREREGEGNVAGPLP